MKFKRHISLFLVLSLLVSNLGLAINVHYCGGKIASIAPVYLKTSSSGLGAEKKCCDAVTKSKESCCKNKVVHFQKKSDKFVVKTFFFNLGFAVLLPDWSPLVFSSAPNFKICSPIPYYCDANAPPFFKLYHQYIFYA